MMNIIKIVVGIMNKIKVNNMTKFFKIKILFEYFNAN